MRTIPKQSVLYTIKGEISGFDRLIADNTQRQAVGGVTPTTFVLGKRQTGKNYG